MPILAAQGRYRPSQSAPTPRKGQCGKMGKCVTALRRRSRPALGFSSPLAFTREVGAHEPAAVRRHLAPGATDWWTTVVDCAEAMVATAVVTLAVGIMASPQCTTFDRVMAPLNDCDF